MKSVVLAVTFAPSVALTVGVTVVVAVAPEQFAVAGVHRDLFGRHVDRRLHE